MQQAVIPVLFLIGLVSTAAAQIPEPFQISINVNLVVLNPTVRDRSGAVCFRFARAEF